MGIALGRKRRVELLSAAGVVNFVQNPTVSQTVYNLPGLTGVAEVGRRPIEVKVWIAGLTHSVANGQCAVWLYEDDVLVGAATQNPPTPNNPVGPLTIIERRAPLPGEHTYRVAVKTNAAATLQAQMGETFPGLLSVVEL